jgi:sec-independent protein translocase protein TatA
MLGLDNPLHLAFLLVILLLVFGAKRLPELGRSLGAGMRGFKDSISGEGSAEAPGPTHVLESPGRAAPVETTPVKTTPLETTAAGREVA